LSEGRATSDREGEKSINIVRRQGNLDREGEKSINIVRSYENFGQRRRKKH
jgi:hypothetical protein